MAFGICYRNWDYETPLFTLDEQPQKALQYFEHLSTETEDGTAANLAFGLLAHSYTEYIFV